jgi:tryptophanyl-tRNA synthetase
MTEGLKALFKFAELFLPDNGFSYNKQFEEGTLQFVEVKDAVAEAIFKELEPIQKKRLEIEANPSYVDKVIAEGAEKARTIAIGTVEEVREKDREVSKFEQDIKERHIKI